MRQILSAAIALLAIALSSCDSTTDTLGYSLTRAGDRAAVSTDTFGVETQSIVVDSVLSRSQSSYIGRVKDTETNTYVTCNFTTQFTIVEDLSDTVSFLPPIDSIASRNEQGQVVATRCEMTIMFSSLNGDSLNPMKLTMHELQTPMAEGVDYYSNFNPKERGLLRTDDNAISKGKAYSAYDLNLSDSLRNTFFTTSSGYAYYPYITIPLNDPYTATDGTTYENYGTYLMRKYYENPENFRNSYNFAHNVCPGFYFEHTDGLGMVGQVNLARLYMEFDYANDSTISGVIALGSSNEVIQVTNIVNDKQRLRDLASDNSCTYLKSPAGIFTEVTLPVDSIVAGHESDTIASARLTFTRLNTAEEEAFAPPTYVLLLPKDSLYSFFENKNTQNNIISYIGAYSSTYNTYTFSNISSLVTAMHHSKQSGSPSENWNKAVLLPVSLTTSSTSSSSTVTNVENEVIPRSAKLIKGSSGKDSPVKLSVIYSSFDN